MRQRRFVFIALLTMLVYGVYIFFLAPIVRERSAVSNIQLEDIDLTEVRDGTYRGVFDTGGYDYEVEVHVAAHRIKEINVLNNRQGEHAQKAEAVTDRVIEAQSLQVDTVSGATTTSKALLKAIENALRSSFKQ
ncbi:MAG: FMN-binding protein [Bacillota bacterium]|nr:FMN-binding protein [Bacillota bacterium]MDW7682612.1 FMN-binding protein [Bacillota bacterium]